MLSQPRDESTGERRRGREAIVEADTDREAIVETDRRFDLLLSVWELCFAWDLCVKRLGDRSDHYDRSAISNKFVRHSVSLGRAPWWGAQVEGATYVASSVPLELCVLYFLCAYWEKSAGHWSALPARSGWWSTRSKWTCCTTRRRRRR